MKKIILTILILITSLNLYAQSTCSRGNDNVPLNVTWCTPNPSMATERIVAGYYSTQAQAYSAAETGLSALKSANPTWNGQYPVQLTSVAHFNASPLVWMAYAVGVTKCGTTSNFGKFRYYFFVNPDWIDTNNDCILDGSDDPDCLKYKPLMKVLDKNSGCLYFAKIMDENCNVSILGDSSILNNAMSGNVDVEIQSFSAPSRNMESSCTMTAPYYDCNNGFTETACSGYDLSKDDNKNNPNVTDIVDGQSTPNEDLQDGVQSGSGDTDSQLLVKIVDNTGKSVANQQTISNQITDIANLIQNQKSYDSELSNHDIINEMKDQENKAQTAFNGIQPPAENDYREQSEFTENDEFSTDLDGKINDVSPDGSVNGVIEKYADNSVLTGFKNSHIEIINPDCSISIPFSLWGNTMNIELNACEWDGLLTQTGNILYICVCIGCFLNVLRGR